MIQLFPPFFRRLVRVFLLLLLTLSFSLPVLAADSGYHVTKIQPLSGSVKWDYLVYDTGSNHLFITHGDHVDVFDTVKEAIIGIIPDTDGVHGVALAPQLDRGFTSNGKSDTVTVFMLSTLKTLNNIAVGKKPDAIVYDPATQRVFAADGESNEISVIDARNNKNLGSILLDGKPEFEAVDKKGRLFVNIEDKNKMDVIDTQKLKLISSYDLSNVCDEPAGLSIDVSREILFAGCHNQKMAVIDGNSGKIIASPAIGRGSDATTYDPGKNLAFSSNSDGTLTVINMDSSNDYAVKQVVKTLPSARTMALDPVSHTIYLVAGIVDHFDPPTKERPFPRPQLKDGSFTLITVSDGSPRSQQK